MHHVRRHAAMHRGSKIPLSGYDLIMEGKGKGKGKGKESAALDCVIVGAGPGGLRDFR